MRDEFMALVMSNLDGEKDAEIERLRSALQEIEHLGPLNDAPDIARSALAFGDRTVGDTLCGYKRRDQIRHAVESIMVSHNGYSSPMLADRITEAVLALTSREGK